MLHGRTDYNPIQDPREGGIGEDEPVMLFRAQDALAPLVLEAYAALVRDRTNEKDLAVAVERHAERMRVWQAENGKSFPDVYQHHYFVEEADRVPEADPNDVESVGGQPGEAADVPVATGPTSQDGHWPKTELPGEDPTAIPEGGQESLGMGLPTMDVPESDLPTSGILDELDVEVKPAADGDSQPELNQSCGEEEAESEAGPLSDAGADLMGGQPTERGESTDGEHHRV